MSTLALISSVESAIVIATHYHYGQLRKNNQEWYINHPLRVMQNIRNAGIFDDDCLAAAILHDVVEDTDYTIEDVYGTFGKDVHNIVSLLTRTDDITYDQYITRLIESNDPYALIIKFFDAHDNSIWISSDGKEKQMKKYINLKSTLQERIKMIGYGSFIEGFVD